MEHINTSVRVPDYMLKLFYMYFPSQKIAEFLRNVTLDIRTDLADNNGSRLVELYLPRKEYAELRRECPHAVAQYYRDAIIEAVLNKVQLEGEKNE